MSNCDVCQGNKKIRVTTYRDVEVQDFEGDTLPSVADQGWKEFDCPQCCMVPFRKVRAMKVSTAYPPETFAKAQAPIERGLAARFGEYLLREGLIRFTTAGSEDFGIGMREDKITITAHLGVVSRDDVRRAGASAEVALTKAPELPENIRRRIKVSKGALRWKPAVDITFPDQEARDEFDPTDEFDEPKDPLAKRFSGLEL